MAFLETRNTESLQCVACAARQVIGPTLNTTSLRQVIQQTHTNQNQIDRFVGIEATIKADLKRWADGNTEQKALDGWLNSSVWIADSLYQSRYLGSGNYKFYRENQFPINVPKVDSFKKVFDILKNKIKQTAKKDPEFAKGTAGQIYNNLKLDNNKWNPADIVAIEDGKESKWQGYLTSIANGNILEIPGVSLQGSMQTDLASYARSIAGGKGPFSGFKRLPGQKKKLEKLEVIPALKDLYDYNKLLYKGIEDKEFVPISLKYATGPNPGVGVFKQTEPADIAKYFGMSVRITKVQMKADDQKAIVYFVVSGIRGDSGKYAFDMRGFETTAKMDNIQIGLMKSGAGAYQGKITLPVTSIITELSGGKSAIAAMNRKKREIFKDPNTGLSQRLQKKLSGGSHKFTDVAIFNEYVKMKKSIDQSQKKPIVKWKNGVPEVERRGRMKDLAQLWIEDVILWGDYVDWLSNGRTKKKDFITEATGRRFYDQVLKKQYGSTKWDKNTGVATEISAQRTWKHYGVTVSSTQAKYMKNKVQSYEVAYVIKNSDLEDRIKKNIVKSMFLYAASKGFTVFNMTQSRTFMLAGPYIKCAK